ncbi:MAG: single-stranded DNA-binding protein [Nitrospiraceae bacterium]
MNTCSLVGRIERRPSLQRHDTGVIMASFSLCVQEVGRNGKVYSIYVPVECYGTLAEGVESLVSGLLVSVTGKLAFRSAEKGRPGALLVLARSVDRVPATGEAA